MADPDRVLGSDEDELPVGPWHLARVVLEIPEPHDPAVVVVREPVRTAQDAQVIPVPEYLVDELQALEGRKVYLSIGDDGVVVKVYEAREPVPATEQRWDG